MNPYCPGCGKPIDPLTQDIGVDDERIWWHDGCWRSWCQRWPDTCKARVS